MQPCRTAWHHHSHFARTSARFQEGSHLRLHCRHSDAGMTNLRERGEIRSVSLSGPFHSRHSPVALLPLEEIMSELTSIATDLVALLFRRHDVPEDCSGMRSCSTSYRHQKHLKKTVRLSGNVTACISNPRTCRGRLLLETTGFSPTASLRDMTETSAQPLEQMELTGAFLLTCTQPLSNHQFPCAPEKQFLGASLNYIWSSMLHKPLCMQLMRCGCFWRNIMPCTHGGPRGPYVTRH